ncbi:MAG: heavy metal translocating P-type ATPase [Terriglobia bacterium]|nr:heavy metal translocating P-type ATPase [Terriglobia bacterium]
MAHSDHKASSHIVAEPSFNGTAKGTVCDLRVGGMDCASCADEIRHALERLKGIEDVSVDVVGGKVQVVYAEGSLARGDLAGAIRRLGYRAEDGDANSAAFIIEGMDCADEVRQIEDKLGNLPDVKKLQFDLMRRRLVVEGSIAATEVERVVKQLGMRARREGEEIRHVGFWERRERLVVTVVSGLLLALGGIAILAGAPRYVLVPILAGSAVAGGWFIAPRGVRAARSGVLDMNFLMTVAAVGAAAIGEWGEGASAMFLFSVAQMLEVYSMDRARNAIKALMSLSPPEATVRRDGTEISIPVQDVRLDETIVIKPGQRIPLDGTVTSGASAVNQAPITGESIPVDKEPGSDIFAGSINENGLLEVRVTKLVEDTTLARITHAVEEAQASRAPSQSFVDRFARIYTPVVVLGAIAVAVAPPLLGVGTWGTWFYRALTMLVIACPCALVISTPVSIVSGLAAAARGGVLIKGGIHLENFGRTTTIAFDKTGTLTKGQPTVVDVMAFDGASANEVLQLAASLEQGSEHPLAQAILREAKSRGLVLAPIDQFESLAGRGIRARVNGATLYLGNEKLCHEMGACTPPSEDALFSAQAQGQTAVVVFSESAPRGIIALADEPRPEAPEAIRLLKLYGVRRLVMLTGDNKDTARAISKRLGIDEFKAELMPDDKVTVVRELENHGGRVAFVGDGVNDAPALAAATVGVAMGAAGTDVALETADVALMADDLSHLPFAMRISRATAAVLRQNIIFSIAIKGVFLVLALFGWATLWMAVAADMGASLAVIINGLRLLRVKHNARSIR